MDPLCGSQRVTGVPKYARALSLALALMGPRGPKPLPMYYSVNASPDPLTRDQENRLSVMSSFWSRFPCILTVCVPHPRGLNSCSPLPSASGPASVQRGLRVASVGALALTSCLASLSPEHGHVTHGALPPGRLLPCFRGSYCRWETALGTSAVKKPSRVPEE